MFLFDGMKVLLVAMFCLLRKISDDVCCDNDISKVFPLQEEVVIKSNSIDVLNEKYLPAHNAFNTFTHIPNTCTRKKTFLE